MSTDLLKDCSLEMKITDHDEKKVNHSLKDIKVSDTEDFVFEFLVPSNTSTIEVLFKCSVKNLSQNKMQELSAKGDKFKIKHHRNDNCLYEMYLSQVGPDYFIYCLGKNGEQLRNQKITLTVKHMDY